MGGIKVKLKTYLLLILLIITIFLAKTSFSQSFGNQLDYFRSNLNELKDENKTNVTNSAMLDSISFNGESSVSYFGGSVTSAGDVNGDGYSDIIVGAQGWNNNSGKAYLFFGGVIMDNIADLVFTGDTVSMFFGCSVSSAGDVNGDGYSDIIVGAEFYYTELRKAYIYFGGEEMDTTADIILNGKFKFGHSVNTAGDINQDGYSDVIVGTYSLSDTGKAFVYFGGGLMNNVADVTLTGEANSNVFGYSVSTAGDVNGDGFSDLIVGAYGYSSNTGRAYIYFGGASMNNIADVTLTGESTFCRFGNKVSSLRDINGDGYSDVIIGAVRYLNFTGRVYLYYGGSTMDITSDAILTGDTANTSYGASISSAGDVNGDGYSDLFIGQPGYHLSKGRALIYNSLLPKPELINPTNNSVNNPISINFKWKKTNSTSYYVLYISMDSTFTSFIVKDTIYSDTSKIVAGFQKNKKYFWLLTAKDTSGNIRNSSIWNFTTIPPIYTNIKLLFEGMYSPAFNQLIRKDSVTAYLRNSNPPFNIIDSAKSYIDSSSFAGSFNFYNASSGTYYISTKHLNSIDTWSKAGGENLVTDGTIYNYDFTTTISQAYGNNLKLKGSKYCLYSGDVNQDGFITLFDLIPIYNDASYFTIGRYLSTDLTGDNIVDLTDVTLCYNNSTNFIRIIQP